MDEEGEVNHKLILLKCAYRKIPQLFLLSILLSFFSCTGNETENDTYEWTWGNSDAKEKTLACSRKSIYNIGCSIFGDIEVRCNRITFSCGYRIMESLPQEIKHYDTQKDKQINDGSLNGFEITGIVLVAVVVHNSAWKGDYTISHDYISAVRVAKTMDVLGNPKEVFFEDVSTNINAYRKCGENSECWGEVLPTFIICWDESRTGNRAYQFLCPRIISRSQSGRKIHSDCDAFTHEHPVLVARNELELTQGLGVYYPLLDKYAKHMEASPKPENWTEWIDEVLPRP